MSNASEAAYWATEASHWRKVAIIFAKVARRWDIVRELSEEERRLKFDRIKHRRTENSN